MADATAIEAPRDRLGPRFVSSAPAAIEWRVEGGRVAKRETGGVTFEAAGPFVAEAELTTSDWVDFVVHATVQGTQPVLEVRVSRPSEGGYLPWEKAVVYATGNVHEFLHRTIPGGSRLGLRISGQGSTEVPALSVREPVRHSARHVLSGEEMHLRGYFSRPAPGGRERVLDAIFVAGNSRFEWAFPRDGKNRVLDFDVAVVPRQGDEGAGALDLRIEARRQGAWRSLLNLSLAKASGDSPWLPSSVALGDADAVRLVTAPAAGGSASKTITFAWGNPVVRIAHPRRLPDVVLFTVDALRTDHVGAYGGKKELTPTLDRMAKSGVLLEQARAAHGETWGALTAIAMADWPENVGVRTRGHPVDRGLRGIVDAFSDAGYITARAGFYLMPPGHFGLFDTESEGPKDQGAFAEIQALLAKEDRPPVFVFSHLAATHYPYAPDDEFLPPGLTPQTSPGFAEIMRTGGSPEARETTRLLYEACIRQTDQYLGRLMPHLEAPGRPGGPALVAVVADHGSHHGEQGVWFLHSTMHASVLRIPMILFAPGRLPPTRIPNLVRSIDVGPTLLDYAGVPGSGFLGRSMRPLVEGRSESGRINVVQIAPLEMVSVENDRYRMIANPRRYRGQWPEFGSALGVEIPQLALYEWRKDPREENDLAPRAPLVLGELWRQATSSTATIERAISPETRRLIMQAGYAEGVQH